MKIGITGADGLLGYHLRALLRCVGGHEVRLATRPTFADPDLLQAFVDGLDAIVHCAGVNRADDADLLNTNIALATQVVEACIATKSKPIIVFADSTHIARDTAYAKGKRGAAEVFEAFAREHRSRFVDLVFPNIFGEFGRPFYNSVVSTFCHQLAHGEEPRIAVDAEMELIHVQDAAARCLAAVTGNETGRQRVPGAATLTVSALLARLRLLHNEYKAQIVPDLRERFDLTLFNTLRSYLFPTHYPVKLQLHTDPRGSLFEGMKTLHGGQVFMSTTVPGIMRGNHFHTRKVERFLVVNGEATIQLRKLFSDEVHTFPVRGDAPCYIDMPTFYAHNITNVGSGTLMTLFWAHEIFDPNDSDTYAEPVIVT